MDNKNGITLRLFAAGAAQAIGYPILRYTAERIGEPAAITAATYIATIVDIALSAICAFQAWEEKRYGLMWFFLIFMLAFVFLLLLDLGHSLFQFDMSLSPFRPLVYRWMVGIGFLVFLLWPKRR